MTTTETPTDEFEVARDKALQALDGGLRLRVRDGRGTRKQIIDEAVLQIARRIELADRLREEVEARRVHDEATTHHLNVALWLHAEALEEIAKLQQALSVAERHDADVRLEAEADVRAELAEKAGA